MTDCLHGMEPSWCSLCLHGLPPRPERPQPTGPPDLAAPVRRIEFRHITEAPTESET